MSGHQETYPWSPFVVTCLNCDHRIPCDTREVAEVAEAAHSKIPGHRAQLAEYPPKGKKP